MRRRPEEMCTWAPAWWSVRTRSVRALASSVPMATTTPVACRAARTRAASLGPPHQRLPRSWAMASSRSPSTPATRKPSSGWSAKRLTSSAASALVPTTSDVADEAAVAAGGGEPRPVGAAADEQERQRGQRAHGDLAVEVTAAEPDVEQARAGPRHDAEDEDGAADAGHLHRAHRGVASEVETVEVQDPDADDGEDGGHAERDQLGPAGVGPRHEGERPRQPDGDDVGGHEDGAEMGPLLDGDPGDETVVAARPRAADRS